MVAKQRPRHPNKEIEAALAYAEGRGWRIVRLRGHAWGKMMCPWNDEECRAGRFAKRRFGARRGNRSITLSAYAGWWTAASAKWGMFRGKSDGQRTERG